MAAYVRMTGSVKPSTEIKGVIESAARLLSVQGVDFTGWKAEHEYRDGDISILFTGRNRFCDYATARISCHFGIWQAYLHRSGLVRGTPKLVFSPEDIANWPGTDNSERDGHADA